MAASVGVQVLTFETSAYADSGAQLTSSGGITVNAADTDRPAEHRRLRCALDKRHRGRWRERGQCLPGCEHPRLHQLRDDGERDRRDSGHRQFGNRPDPSRTQQPDQDHAAGRTRRWRFPAAPRGGSASDQRLPVIVDVLTLRDGASTSAPARRSTRRHRLHQQGAPSQAITVTATDNTHLVNVAGALGLTTGDAGIGIGLDRRRDHQGRLHCIRRRIRQCPAPAAGQVGANSSETLFELALAGGASTGTSVAGAIIVVAFPTSPALLGHHLPRRPAATGSAPASAPMRWSAPRVRLRSGQATTRRLTPFSPTFALGTGTAGIGASAVILVRDANVDASDCSLAPRSATNGGYLA